MNKIILAVVFLCGCAPDSWIDTPNEYDCTEAQMIIVDRETKNCHNTGYKGTYCYATAIKRRCVLMEQNNE